MGQVLSERRPFLFGVDRLGNRGVSRVGAVCFPALDEVLSAADGLGCWWNDKLTRVSDVSEFKQAIFIYTSWSGFRTRQRLDVFENLHKECFFGRGWATRTAITWWQPDAPK